MKRIATKVSSHPSLSRRPSLLSFSLEMCICIMHSYIVIVYTYGGVTRPKERTWADMALSAGRALYIRSDTSGKRVVYCSYSAHTLLSLSLSLSLVSVCCYSPLCAGSARARPAGIHAYRHKLFARARPLHGSAARRVYAFRAARRGGRLFSPCA